MKSGIPQPSDQLDRLVRFFSTVNGTDKTLMLIQYTTKIIAWYADRQGSKLGANARALGGPVADFRILLRYYGLLPLLQYHQAIEQAPPPSRSLTTVIRLQNASMFLYYPMEHVYWLAAHKVIRMRSGTVDQVGYWSCRFWAIYVLLEYLRLHLIRQDRQTREAEVRESLISPEADAPGPKGAEKDPRPHSSRREGERLLRGFRQEREQWWTSFLINSAYFPLTFHWSIEGSTFPDVAVGICGTIAAILQFRNAWGSTA
ncbi:peroxisomal biogenesis factor 11 [Piptocephalis cylindrospora]|uniref:Peroxisomal biogenesis factor 11 n=1 Tax=Piptocephalis cylindrospora TaxID=1907219 RepID=A0A4P9Y5J7_9FUNG|nr:peroxisomal biogenesis factor 11 [Piptocephalis cylindrospora]|eukprot:RKP14298.1 peroxisomal biogenesis factor 11 [Piptocephalis cylindrospora]